MNRLGLLIESPDRISEIPAAEVPALVAKLAALQCLLTSRWPLVAPKGSAAPATEDDTLLTAEQAAPILGVTPNWLYRHAKKLPFSRRLSRKVLRFSESGLKKYLAIKRY